LAAEFLRGPSVPRRRAVGLMQDARHVAPARKAAFPILMAVERGQSHSDDLLRGKASTRSRPRTAIWPRRWCWACCAGRLASITNCKRCSRAPTPSSTRRFASRCVWVPFQLLHLDRIPARAAIDESVELTKQAGHRFASGMVNAVLRKLASGEASHFRFSEETAPEALSLAQAHPAWMVERWASFYGLDAARAICLHGQSQPALTIRLESLALEEELSATGVRLEPGEMLSAARTVVSGDPGATVAFNEGRVRLQDEGSQLVAEIASLSGGKLDQKDKSILDACAAPGGKTLILAERMPHARIVACEFSPQRLAQLRKRLAPLGDRVECRLADATSLAGDSIYDLVLADVPCSGTGTLSRNPEIRHRLRLGDLPRQAGRQRAILMPQPCALSALAGV
jgi:16S rRNA (cytosine967-C5)-methyltransferase